MSHWIAQGARSGTDKSSAHHATMNCKIRDDVGSVTANLRNVTANFRDVTANFRDVTANFAVT